MNAVAVWWYTCRKVTIRKSNKLKSLFKKFKKKSIELTLTLLLSEHEKYLKTSEILDKQFLLLSNWTVNSPCPTSPQFLKRKTTTRLGESRLSGWDLFGNRSSWQTLWGARFECPVKSVSSVKKKIFTFISMNTHSGAHPERETHLVCVVAY